MRSLVPLVALALAAVPRALGAQVAAHSPAPLAGLDAYVERAMKEWEVPGVAIAVVKNDSVVLARGYGVRELGRPGRVDASTQFAIASATKAFTAALVGMLVDEGKVRWDDPAAQYLPGFQLYDPYVTRELTVRDLLTHRSGLARGDLLWYATTTPDTAILRRVRYLRPSWSVRSRFGYQNLMYIAAGQVVANAGGKPWAELVRERIFVPLGMTATSTSIAAFRGNPNVAQPHEKIDDTVRAIRWKNWDNVGAAGAINSNVADLAKWVRFQLDSARVGGRGGKRLLTAGAFEETHTPQTAIRREAQTREAYPFTNFQAYGLGWFLEDYRGREVVHHGGNLDGMSSEVALLPSERLGVAILTNMDATALRDVLWRRVFDLYLGAPPKDWSRDVLLVRQKALKQAKEVERKKEAQRVAGTRPSLALDKYAGTYADSLYGDVQVKPEGGRLVLTFGPGFVGDLEHWHYDTFRARWRDQSLGKALATFALGADARVSEVTVENVGTFRRQDKPDTAARVRLAEAEMRRVVGSYRAAEAPMTVAVDVVGGALKLSFPGQPPYAMVPLTKSRFQLAGGDLPAGFFVTLDAAGGAGEVRRFTLEQPAPRPTLTFSRP